MSGDNDLTQAVARLGRAFEALANSQQKLAEELTRQCEAQAEHFERVCRTLDERVQDADAEQSPCHDRDAMSFSACPQRRAA